MIPRPFPKMTFESRSFPFAALVAVVGFGCSSGDDHPDSQRDPTIQQATDEVVARAAAADEAADSGTGDGAPRQLCVPDSTQDCHLYYMDSSGQQHCPLSSQICKSDGSDWWPCGTRPTQTAE
jgi:hypothetical protein